MLASEYFSQANLLKPNFNINPDNRIDLWTPDPDLHISLFPVSGCDRGLPVSPSDHLKITFPALASDLTAAARASTPIIRILRAAIALPNIC